jgi:hypothetical protein
VKEVSRNGTKNGTNEEAKANQSATGIGKDGNYEGIEEGMKEALTLEEPILVVKMLNIPM